MDKIQEIIKGLKDCTVWPEIKVGEVIPNSINFDYDGGCGWMNLGSNWLVFLFEKHLKTLQDAPYEFSEICRSENEKKAFELAIIENCIGLKLNVTNLTTTQTQNNK